MPDKKERLIVNIRPAQESDTPGVMELSSRIWDGEDYVPYVWSEWLSDSRGMLVVADYQQRVIGLGKLTRLSEEDWWLEGLRVQPDFEGRGIASQIHEFLMETWTKIGSGTVRLGTASYNLAVQHICNRLGFRKVAEFSPFGAPSLMEPVPESDRTYHSQPPADELVPMGSDEENSSLDYSPTFVFEPVAFEEVTKATDFALYSESLALSSGLINLGWQWAPPREEYLSQIIEEHKAWWWRERRGLLAIDEQKGSSKEPAATVILLACSFKDIGEMLPDYRRLAALLGYRRAAWMVPLESSLLSVFPAANFEREWDDSIYIYSRP